MHALLEPFGILGCSTCVRALLERWLRRNGTSTWYQVPYTTVRLKPPPDLIDSFFFLSQHSFPSSVSPAAPPAIDLLSACLWLAFDNKRLMELESVSASGEVNGYNNSESVSDSGARTQQTPSQNRTSTDGVSDDDNMDRKSSPVESNMHTFESIEKELQPNIGLLMSPPAVVHHVDYRSKAEERKAELEALRRKSLAKPQGTISMLSTLNFVYLYKEYFSYH